jgi:hypothetical protein
LSLTQLVVSIGKLFGKVMGAVADFSGIERDRNAEN